MKNTCSKCGKIKELTTKRYCRICANLYLREWRKTHTVSEEQGLKGIVRAKTKMRIRRGLLLKQPCEICGDAEVESHHDDYSKPYDVRWLCFKHHREHHKSINKKPKKITAIRKRLVRKKSNYAFVL